MYGFPQPPQAAPRHGGTRLISLTDGELLLAYDGERLTLPEASPEDIENALFRFSTRSLDVAVAGHPAHSSCDGLRKELRESFASLTSEEWEAAAKAAELLYWHRDTRYCRRCGTQLEHATEISKRCPACGCEEWPRLNPAIIVLVRDGERALLVHARNFRRPFYGLVAGFVETGESLEECVRREVREETSLEVENIRYFGSQSWPFPSQLMLGFTADRVAGEVRFADGELTAGGFFTRDNLPPLASPPSLARSLIDHWIADTGADG